MADFTDSLAISASAMRAQTTRLRHISENIANADTPGYRRKMISFEPAKTETAPQGAIEAGPVTLDRSTLKEVYDPGNPLSDSSGHYAGSNVDLLIEIADAREAQRSYQANLQMFDQSRQMTSGLLELLRR